MFVICGGWRSRALRHVTILCILGILALPVTGFAQDTLVEPGQPEVFAAQTQASTPEELPTEEPEPQEVLPEPPVETEIPEPVVEPTLVPTEPPIPVETEVPEEAPAPVEPVIPEPTPTPEPVIPSAPIELAVPTVPPAPTEMPLPILKPTAAPTAIPTVAPTPTPTPTEAPKPSRSSGDMELAVVTPGDGSISGCIQSPASDMIEPGGVLSATCTLDPTKNELRIQVAAPYSSNADFAVDWQVRVTMEWEWQKSRDTGWQKGAAEVVVKQGDLPKRGDTVTLTIWLQAPTDAVMGSPYVSTRVDSVNCTNSCTSLGGVTLSARTAPLDSRHVSVGCSPTSPLIVPRRSSETITCTVYALSGLGTTSLVVESVTISGPPAGWTMSSPSGTVGTGGAITILANQTVPAGGSWSFTLALSPSCTATASASWSVTSQVANTNGRVTGAVQAGPSSGFAANAAATIQTVSATVTGSSLEWSFPYSFEDQTGSGALTYHVTGEGCSGWSISIVADPFTYTGTAPGSTIQAGDLTLTSAGVPIVLYGSGSGVDALPPNGSLDVVSKVLRATPGSGNGTYAQDLGMNLTVPGGTLIGSYRSNITIITASAP